MESPKYDYDCIVIGGGSAGLAFAKAAASYQKTVALLDYVWPSPQGTTYGVGGTCVNVGCIPKRLLHDAASIAETIHDAPAHGFDNLPCCVPKKIVDDQGLVNENVRDCQTHGHEGFKSNQVNWSTLIDKVQAHIKRLNRAYITELKWSNYVKYHNALGSFVGPHQVKFTYDDGREEIKTGEHVIVAVGGRPSIPQDLPGVEHCITSDDIFSKKTPPGKTAIIGASYIALETAGFLNGLGYSATVFIRSTPLRGFDQQIATMVVNYMENHGVRFMRQTTPTSIEKLENGKFKVNWNGGSEEFDTVFLATGRTPNTGRLNLESAGIRYNKQTMKIPTVKESTNVPGHHAVGDVVHRGLELTPVAIGAAKMLANRLFGNETRGFSYQFVPTTIFTPLEYGCCGISEEDAINQYGEEAITVYHTNFQPLEWVIPGRPSGACYVKLICLKAENERVLGAHYLGPNAAEVTQGYAVALRMGATKEHIDNTPGIHPSNAEVLVYLNITKESGASSKRGNC
ncbi:hypothetical protein RCL1_006611 [Eukaryota sp. TZLM3-RCL]